MAPGSRRGRRHAPETDRETDDCAGECGASFGVSGVSVSGELGRSSFGSSSGGGTALSMAGRRILELEQKSKPASHEAGSWDAFPSMLFGGRSSRRATRPKGGGRRPSYR